MLIACVLGMVMRVWMTMSSSTRTGTTAVMKRILMLMRSELVDWGDMHDSAYTVTFS